MDEAGTILIVDDNPNNLEVLKGILEMNGFSVRAALSGEIALRCLDRFIPDLILLDIRMPGLNGYEACKRLKENELTRNIPVIFISALQDIQDKLMAFQVGGVDYVTKPFQELEIISRVKTHIQLHRIQTNLERLVEQRTRALSLSEARYRVLFEDSPVAVIIYDADNGMILESNRTCCQLFGCALETMVGQPIGFAMGDKQRDELLAQANTLTTHSNETVYTGPLHFHLNDGRLLEAEGIMHRIDYPAHRAHILMLQDVTARHQAEEHLQHMAKSYEQKIERLSQFDQLTGLPTREVLTERMQQGISQSKLTSTWMVVCYVDLDRFGQINEMYGRHVGDNLLISATESMRSCLRGGDTLARIGSDEFALLLLGVKTDEEIDAFISCLQSHLTSPFIDDNFTISLSASIGCTVYPQDGADPDTLLRHADQAMMTAKQAEKSGFKRFDTEADKHIRSQQKNIADMRLALERREFVLYYQPKVDMSQGVVIGAEALIRWQHPMRGLLQPGAFLPEIEEDEFMIEMSDWVFSEALAQMSRWRDEGVDLAVSVNISAMHLMQPDFVERLREHLGAQPDTPAGKLEIEVLETSSLGDLKIIQQIILACQKLGVGFSLDDFGTGYSSLAYLRQLSADTLKIDQSFVRNMLEVSEDLAIISGVVGLAAAFKRNVIAEGVETIEHGKLLLQLGCTMAQGYGIARPMPAEDLPGWVATWPHGGWRDMVMRSSE